MQDPNKTQIGGPSLLDPNRTQLGGGPVLDPNRTMMGTAPNLNATVTIKPVQCPVCKTFNPVAVMYCVECGLIFDMALDGDAFGAPTVQLPVLVESTGREHTLRPGPNVLGRQADLVFEDSRVSRRHAQLTIEPDGLFIEDLGSTNGTKLNGDPLIQGARKPLNSGDKVSLGGFDLTLSLPGEANKTLAAMSGRTAAISAAPTTQTAVAWLMLDDREIPLELGEHSFGRKSENDIPLSDPYISGRHGTFSVDQSGVFFTDTGSTNGTLLNDAKLAPNQKTQLRVGDVIKLGAITIKLRFKE